MKKKKNNVKLQLQKDMNDILDIDSENSPYSKNTDGESSISFSDRPINNSYISKYLLTIFGESQVTVANLNEKIAEANKRTRTYINELIKGDARPERKLQSIEEIKKQLNKLIPERLRELQTSGAPAYRTKSSKTSFEAFETLLNDKEKGLPPEIDEKSTPEVLKAFERFVFKLYHPDKGNKKKISNYFYGERYGKETRTGWRIRTMVNGTVGRRSCKILARNTT